jgi:ferric-dicitrate binding protein FerR (iron transport regulator)
MTPCEQASAWMSDSLAGEIEPEALAPLESHLEACDVCRAEFDRFVLQERALGELVGISLAHELRSRVRTGLATRRSWVRRLVLVAASLPLAITAVVVWKFAPADRGPAIATIDAVSGEVFIGAERASLGDSLTEGQGLQTRGTESHAVVRYADGTQVELDGNTTVERFRDGSGKEAFLARGTIRAAVARQPADRPMILSSPQAQATVVGTRLRLVVDPKASTRLEVEDGKVRLKRTQDGAAVDVPAGTYAVAAKGVPLAAQALPKAGKATIVQAGESLALTEDLVLSGTDTLEIKGTPERPCALVGNRHRIRTSGTWTGKVRIAHCDVRELGDRVTFSPEGKITSQAPALELTASQDAEISIDRATFRASSSVRLRLDGASTARFTNSVCAEDSVVSVDKARERSFAFFEATGSSGAPKVFQGNRVYRSYVEVTGKNWTIGGETDAESNLIIGLRAGLLAYGEGTIVRGNYFHVLMPRTAEYPYWSQVSTFTTARGALAEHNVIRDGEWIVQFVEGEFRHNLICDINDHNLLRNASTGRIHHNIFVAGKPDHPPGSMGGCIFIVYAPKDGQSGAEIWNNTFDAGGTMNVPGLEMNSGGFVKSLRNNVYYNFGHQEKFGKGGQAMIRPVWTEPLSDPPPNQLGYADYNAFYSPIAKVKKNYALGVEGKKERKDAGFALNDLPRGGAPNEQVDPKFKGPIPATFAFSDEDIKTGKVAVSKILAFYRDAYTPAPGSPLIDAGDPADGEGTDIGAVPATPR